MQTQKNSAPNVLETESSTSTTNADLILGQNALKSQALQPLQLVEIGVGLGDLSKRLLSIASLIAYEIDEALCSFVLQRFEKENLLGHFDLIQADVLSLPFAMQENMQKINENKPARQAKSVHKAKKKQEIRNKNSTNDKVQISQKITNEDKKITSWLSTSPYLLVSNLPYYIATRIILNALKDPLCVGFVVMTQKEVAEKFCALSGNKEFCALSVLAQSIGELKLLFDVPKEAFNPAPKVTSSVFSLHKKQNLVPSKNNGTEHYDFEVLLKSAFASPRKKLFSNLTKQYDKSLIEQIFTTLNISQDARAHQLTKEDYHHIYQLIKDQR